MKRYKIKEFREGPIGTEWGVFDTVKKDFIRDTSHYCICSPVKSHIKTLAMILEHKIKKESING